MMSKPRSPPHLHELFLEAYPLARRAAQVRSATVIGLLREAALDREDLEQEALVKVYTAITRFDRSRASLRTFVERIVATSITSVFRRNRAGKRTKRLDYEPVDSLQLLVKTELRLDIQQVLGKLRPRDRKVARLLVEHCPAEVARRLHISRAAVYRCIKRIRTLLKGGGFY